MADLHEFQGGTQAVADEVDDNFSFALGNQLAFIFELDTLGASLGDVQNLIFDRFTTGTTVSESLNMRYDSGGQKWVCLTDTDFYIEIEATSVTAATITGFNANVFVSQTASNKWIVGSSTHASLDDNAREVMHALFWALGTGATNPRGTTGLIGLKTPFASYQGKKIIYTTIQNGCPSCDISFSHRLDITWTTANVKVMTLLSTNVTPTAGGFSRIESPAGSTIHTVGGIGGLFSTIPGGPNFAVGWETYTPASDIQLELGSSTAGFTSTRDWRADLLLMFESSEAPSFVQTSGGPSPIFNKTGDFIVGTLATGLGTAYIITTATAISSQSDVGIALVHYNIDATSSITIQASNDNGGSWTTIGQQSIARVLPAGTNVKHKIIITRTDTTQPDEITEYDAFYG